MDHYETLGIQDRACPPDEIKRAFRRAAAAAHPDREGGSDERMQAVNRANAVLGDPEARARYDATGDDPAAPGVTPEQKARAALMETFAAFLDHPDADSDDILDKLRASFEITIDEVKRKRPKAERKAAKARKMLSRLSVKSGDNFLAIVVQNRIKSAEAEVAFYDESVKLMGIIMEQLGNYEYGPDLDPQAPEEPDAGADLMADLEAMMSRMSEGMGSRGPRGGMFGSMFGGYDFPKEEGPPKGAGRQEPPRPRGPQPRGGGKSWQKL